MKIISRLTKLGGTELSLRAVVCTCVGFGILIVASFAPLIRMILTPAPRMDALDFTPT